MKLIRFVLIVISVALYVLSPMLVAKNQEVEIKDTVRSFLNHIGSKELVPGVAFGNTIDQNYRSTYWPEYEGDVDDLAQEVFYGALKQMYDSKIVDIRSKGNHACVFVEKEDVIFSLSMIKEQIWKFMLPSMSRRSDGKNAKCWELTWLLNINDSSFIELHIDDESKSGSEFKKARYGDSDLVFKILISSGVVDKIESTLSRKQSDYLKLFEFDAKNQKKIEAKFEETFNRILGAHVIAFYEEFSEGDIEKLARISNITELNSYINSNVRYQKKIDSVLEKRIEQLFLEIEDKKAQ